MSDDVLKPDGLSSASKPKTGDGSEANQEKKYTGAHGSVSTSRRQIPSATCLIVQVKKTTNALISPSLSKELENEGVYYDKPLFISHLKSSPDAVIS